MTADRIPALLEPIQNRLNAVTPGPWEWEGNDIVRTESNWTTVLEGLPASPGASPVRTLRKGSIMSQERIVAAAKAIAKQDRTELNTYRDQAEAALIAADAVMLSDEGVERIKKALGDHMEGSLSCYDHIPSSGHYVWCCAGGEHAITETWREHMARAVVAALKGDQ